VAVDSSLTPGSVRVAEEGGERVLYYHPEDASKVRATIRSFARSTEDTPEQLKGSVESALRTAAADSRSISEALHLPPALGGVHERGLVPTSGVRLASTTPWTRTGVVPSSHAPVLTALEDPSVFPMVIERKANTYVISYRGESIQADDAAGALDAVVDATTREAGGRTVHLHFKGVNDEQAEGFSQVAELHGGDGGAKRVRASIDTADGDAIAVLGDLRRGKWDLRKAEVRVLDPTPNAVDRAVELEIQIPEATGIGKLLMHIRLTFARGVQLTAEFINGLAEAVRGVLQTISMTGENVDLLLASRRIVTTLRAHDDSIAAVRARLRSQAGEIHIVRYVPTTAGAASE
jgi:hypothetical protein